MTAREQTGHTSAVRPDGKTAGDLGPAARGGGANAWRSTAPLLDRFDMSKLAQRAPSTSNHRKPSVLAVGVLALLAALAIPATASAGTYTINNCPLAPSANDNQGSWTIFGSPQADAGSCDGSGSFIGPLGGSKGPNALAGVQISAPAGSGITIEHAKLWWYVASSSGATTFAIMSASGNVVLQADAPFDARSTPTDIALPSNTTSLTAAAYCANDDAGGGCGYGGGENEILGMYGAQLTLADSNLPGGSVTGGSLAGGGPMSGTGSLAFDATDSDSGVRLVQLLVDDNVAAQHDYIAQCPYQDFAACPHQISDTISFNTAILSNGPHDIALRVINAAQNPATIDDHTVIVDNPAGARLGAPNGDWPCAGEALRLRVGRRRAQVTVRYGRSVRIDGLLHCGRTPIAGARVLVSGGGLGRSVMTATNGSFALTVPRGHSRDLTFTYIPYAGESVPAARATATVAVRPRITLLVRPRQLVNGQVMKWTGRVLGGPYPPAGVTLDAEVRQGRRWKVFDQVESTGRGRFTYAYQFRRTFAPTTYLFRIALPLTGAHDYPYAPGASKVVTEYVR